MPRTLATLGDFCHLFPVLEKLLAPLHLPLSNGDIGLHINFSTDKQHRKVHFPTYSFELLRLRWCSQRDLTLFIKNSYFFLFVAFSLSSFVFTHITFIDILLLFLHNLPWFVSFVQVYYKCYPFGFIVYLGWIVFLSHFLWSSLTSHLSPDIVQRILSFCCLLSCFLVCQFPHQ